MKADILVNKTMSEAQTLDVDELDDYFIKMAILSIAVLRGRHGNQYAKDFLKGALNDKKPIKVTVELMQ